MRSLYSWGGLVKLFTLRWVSHAYPALVMLFTLFTLLLWVWVTLFTLLLGGCVSLGGCADASNYFTVGVGEVIHSFTKYVGFRRRLWSCNSLFFPSKLSYQAL